MQECVDKLLGQLDGQTLIADRVFPSPSAAMTLFTKQVLDSVLIDYATILIDGTRHGAETDTYLKAVVGSYQQCRRLVLYLNKPKDADKKFVLGLLEYVDSLFEPHVETFLRVELDFYRRSCDSVVESWKKKADPRSK
jgi:recyclin-1